MLTHEQEVAYALLNENAEYKRAWPGSKFARRLTKWRLSILKQWSVFLRTYTSVFMRLQHLTTAQNVIKRHNDNVTVIFLSENGDFDKGSKKEARTLHYGHKLL